MGTGEDGRKMKNGEWALHVKRLEVFIAKWEKGSVDIGKISGGVQQGLLTCIPWCEVRTSSTRKGRTHQWTWKEVNQSREKNQNGDMRRQKSGNSEG